MVPQEAAKRYRRAVSTNLRLSESTAAALRELSRTSGRSQQELIREALDRYLGRAPNPDDRRRAIDSGLVRPPTDFLDIEPVVVPSRTIAELLDRDSDR